MSKYILISSMLFVACGPPCDTMINGLCIIINDTSIDHDAASEGSTLAQDLWSDEFGPTNMSDLADAHGLVIYYEDKNAFGHSDLRGTFTWYNNGIASPFVRVLSDSEFNEYQQCMTGYVLGHELLHFLEYTATGSGSINHSDPRIWLNIDLAIYSNMARFCLGNE